MNSFFVALCVALCISSASAIKKWSLSHPAAARRLGEITVVDSHDNRDDEYCIVGGIESDAPGKVYVGGPCNALNVDANGQNPQPTADFKYVWMETIYAQVINAEGDELPLAAVDFNQYNHLHTTPFKYAETGFYVDSKVKNEGEGAKYKNA